MDAKFSFTVSPPEVSVDPTIYENISGKSKLLSGTPTHFGTARVCGLQKEVHANVGIQNIGWSHNC